MKKQKIRDNVFWIGAIDHDLRVFDIIMYTEFGTTYNAYLIKGSEKTALIETVKHTFTDEYIEKLEEEIDLATIDYIILNHTEPDHVGTVGKLLDKAKNAVLLGSEAAIDFMKEIANKEFEYLIVRQDDEICLGDKTLKFIDAPFLHWPDTIYTYVIEDKILFTCDSFGAHYAFDDILASKIVNRDDYLKAMKYYYDMIIAPFNGYMLKAIEKIKDLDIDIIATGHGPVIDIKVKETIAKWKEWATIEKRASKTIVIPYVSAYGYTEKLAFKIKEGIEETSDLEVKLYDMVYADQEEVINEIFFAEGVLFGTPTINSDALLPIMRLLIEFDVQALFKSYANNEVFGKRKENIKNINDVLDIAAKTEKVTVDYYTDLLKYAKEPLKAILERLIEEEQGHYDQIMNLIAL